MTADDTKELHVSVSECCRALFHKIPKVTCERPPGCTEYFYARCETCQKPCHTMYSRIFDSAGVEIRPGDLIECPELPADDAERWHACYLADYGRRPQIEIRDLGNNNTSIYRCYDYFTRGPYWRHLDKVTDEDLEYYWQTTRAEAELKAKAG